MKKKESDQIIEALLFANATPINQSQLNQVFDNSIRAKRANCIYCNKRGISSIISLFPSQVELR